MSPWFGCSQLVLNQNQAQDWEMGTCPGWQVRLQNYPSPLHCIALHCTAHPASSAAALMVQLLDWERKGESTDRGAFWACSVVVTEVASPLHTPPLQPGQVCWGTSSSALMVQLLQGQREERSAEWAESAPWGWWRCPHQTTPFLDGWVLLAPEVRSESTLGWLSNRDGSGSSQLPSDLFRSKSSAPFQPPN